MELIDYPQAIADTSKQLLGVDQQVRQLEKESEQFKLTIDSHVCFDSILKNQNQRDCRRAEMLRDNAQYQALLAQLEVARQERSSVRIQLKYLQDRFSALKLSLLAKLEFLSRVESLNDIRVHLAGLGLEGFFAAYSAVGGTSPSEAAEQILVFVEALVAKLEQGEVMSEELWMQRVSVSESQGDESELL